MSDAKLRKALDKICYEDDSSGHEGLDAAREMCQWFLGDPNWADEVLEAYLDPEKARMKLAAAKAQYA